MTEFNINDHVMVRLTKHGKELLAKRIPVPEIARETDGWTTWQMWRLMQEFGPDMHMGLDPPFEPTIRLLEGSKSWT